MKVIKTNNFIKPLIVLIGVAATLTMPSQMAFADETLQPGSHMPAKDVSPDPKTFDDEHSVVRTTPTQGPSFPTPAYRKGVGDWQTLNGQADGGAYGFSSAAFQRPLRTDHSFSLKSHGYITSANNYLYTSDFLGIGLSTASADKLSSAQSGGVKGKAGYANPDVAWQTTFGTQAFGETHYTFLVPGITSMDHKNFVRQTIYGKQTPVTERPFDSTRWKAKPISEEYNVNYDADTRKISYTDNKGLTATTDIPKEVPRVYIGILTSVQGNGYYDKSYIGLDDISGTYDTTTTTVRFVDKDGNSLADDAKIDSIIGAKISISGSAEENWLAPDIPHATLAGSAADRTITTTEDESKNVITVRYDAVSGKLPVKIFDDTDTANKIPDTSLPVVIGQTYNYSVKDLAKVIPANTHIVSLEKNSGTVAADDQNNVTNEPMVIHVAHDTKSEDVTFSRTVHYEGPASLKVPDDNVQKTTVTRTTDNYTGKTTTNKPAAWLDVKTPDIKGYEPDIKKVHWDSIDANPSETLSQTVTYKGVFKVYAPDAMDFGTITIGDKYYQGKATKSAKQVHGSLYVAHTDAAMANRNWRLTAKLDQNFMVGKPTLQIAYGQYEINSDYETEIANQSDSSTDGITDTAINENTPGMVGLKLDRSAQQSNVQAGKDYHGTITWTLGTVPA